MVALEGEGGFIISLLLVDDQVHVGALLVQVCVRGVPRCGVGVGGGGEGGRGQAVPIHGGGAAACWWADTG